MTCHTTGRNIESITPIKMIIFCILVTRNIIDLTFKLITNSEKYHILSLHNSTYICLKKLTLNVRNLSFEELD